MGVVLPKPQPTVGVVSVKCTQPRVGVVNQEWVWSM